MANNLNPSSLFNNDFLDTSSKLTNPNIIELYSKEDLILTFIGKKNVRGSYHSIVQLGDNSSLPYIMRDDVNNLTEWIDNRVIPTNQEHVKEVLDSIANTGENRLDLLLVNHGFSLNDNFWLKEVEDNKTNWKNNNLYDNEFDKALGMIAFFGHKSSLAGNINNSPELTTQGMMAKAWRRIDNDIYLYKKSPNRYANCGKDHIAEYLAYRLGFTLGFDVVEYSIGTWKDEKCSICKLFTSNKVGYLTANEYMNSNYRGERWSFDTVYNINKSLGLEKKFIEMIIFDFIIENTDRHFNNFGYLVDSKTMEIVDYAPLFDHGYSLLSRSIKEDFSNNNYSSYRPEGTFRVSNYEQVEFLEEYLDRDTKVYYINKFRDLYKSLPRLEFFNNRHFPSWYIDMVKGLVQSRSEELIEIFSK